MSLLSAVFAQSPEPESCGLEGDTLVQEQADSSSGTVDDDDETAVFAAGTYPTTSEGKTVKLALKDRLLQSGDPRVQDWTANEIWLHNKMVMRSEEVVMPFAWANDFPSFPDSLFAKGSAQTFINNENTPVFEGTTPSLTLWHIACIAIA